MKLWHLPSTEWACYEPFIATVLPHVFVGSVAGEYGWCRFTEHDYGDFRTHPEVVTMMEWLDAYPGRYITEQSGPSCIDTFFLLYIEDPATAALFEIAFKVEDAHAM